MSSPLAIIPTPTPSMLRAARCWRRVTGTRTPRPRTALRRIPLHPARPPLPAQTTPNINTSTGAVDEAKAQEIALAHAGVKAADATITKSKLDYDDGRQVYEIEWYANGAKYDYEIDAATGKIVSYDYDAENYTPSQSTNTNANVKISEATAKQIALSSVPGATAANIYKFKLDFDDGRWEYEGEIRYGTMEYDFTIDANTGAIIEWDMESIYD